MHGTLRLQLRIRTKIVAIALLWAMFSQHSGDSLVATSTTITEKKKALELKELNWKSEFSLIFNSKCKAVKPTVIDLNKYF